MSPEDLAEEFAESVTTPFTKPMKEVFVRAWMCGWKAAEYDAPAMRVLASLRWRAHRENQEDLAELIAELEYCIQHWNHLPTREMKLPEVKT